MICSALDFLKDQGHLFQRQEWIMIVCEKSYIILKIEVLQKMSLISSNGGKTSAPDRSIKEKILNEQIENLRDIHRQSFETFDKIVLTLKKMINFKNEHVDKERNQILIKNVFLQNLGAMEESLISLIEDLESDQQLFNCTSLFRDSEKRLENQSFMKNMKCYEQFKDDLTSTIQQLQKQIQKLQTNGYHIYAHYIKPNNVLNSLKKVNLDKYLVLMNHFDSIFKQLKNTMGMAPQEEKNQQKMVIPDVTRLKSQEYLKILKNIYWKEQSRQMMLTEQIQKSKTAFAKESQKMKITEQALKKTSVNTNNLKTMMKICSEEENPTKEQVVSFLQALKEKADHSHILTPHLFTTVKGRSISCHSVFSRGNTRKPKRDNIEMLKMEEYSNILGPDFLQESLYI